MKDHRSSASGVGLQALPRARVAVVGGGIAGLTCARELLLRGCDVVVFEADARLGGRCSSRNTPAGVFDDAAQYIHGATRLAAHAVQAPGELAALHPWTVAAAPAEPPPGKPASQAAEDEDDAERPLRLLGAVGVPSMRALAEALARPLQVRLNTPIVQARRRGAMWALSSAAGEVEERFHALVLAVPAPRALPLASESPQLMGALAAVRYRSRWVLLLGSERHVALPGYREFQGSPIERVAAMHSKPGRVTTGPERWFVEADERWSAQHEDADTDTVAELLLENFRAHAHRPVKPSYLRALKWRHAFVETPALATAMAPVRTECLWDEAVCLGICGDSVVSSQVDRVHRSGIDMARAVADHLAPPGASLRFSGVDRQRGQRLEAHL